MPPTANIVALSKLETILVSSSGDVVVSRCRDTSYPVPVAPEFAAPYYKWRDDIALVCCDGPPCDDLSVQVQDSATFCNPFSRSNKKQQQSPPPPASHQQQNQQSQSNAINNTSMTTTTSTGSETYSNMTVGGVVGTGTATTTTNTSTNTPKRKGGIPSNGRVGGGLLGGAPIDVVSPLHPSNQQHHYTKDAVPSSFAHSAQRAFRSQPFPDTGFDEQSIVPIRSFDYSHFAEGGNDMIPSPPRQLPSTNNNNTTTKTSSPTTTTTTLLSTPPKHKSLFQLPPCLPRGIDDDHLRKENNENEPYPHHQSTTSSGPLANNHTTYQAPVLMHGIPTFLPVFSHVKITQVSAHALGSHVLLISNAGLLYSYGLNDYGQLGIGLKTRSDGYHRGYVMTPTILTPLVEHGGKAILCAAGVSHSLVVIVTEQRRLIKSSQSLDSTIGMKSSNSNNNTTSPSPSSLMTQSVTYHQMYGFGRNDYMKIGLVSPKIAKTGSPDEMESVLMPRRVALRCKVYPQLLIPNQSTATSSSSLSQLNDHQYLPMGIFDVQASEQHSAALVRRSSGDVELYMWGSAMHGALGLPQPLLPGHLVSANSINTPSRMNTSSTLRKEVHASPLSPSNTITTSSAAVRVVPVPSFVAKLSQTTSNPDANAYSILDKRLGEYPTCISLGRYCSFVVTSLGRCFSFGISEDGMLGQGSRIIESHEPTEICLPQQYNDQQYRNSSSPAIEDGYFIQSISAGATHTLATTRNGQVYAWGTKIPAGILLDPIGSGGGGGHDDSSTEASDRDHYYHHHVGPIDHIQWSPKRLTIRRHRSRTIPTVPSGNSSGVSTKPTSGTRIAYAVAGYDNSVLVTEAGRVLSCGKATGRLGLGEVNQDVVVQPRPMFGGLRLWHKDNHHRHNQQQQPCKVSEPSRDNNNYGESASISSKLNNTTTAPSTAHGTTPVTNAATSSPRPHIPIFPVRKLTRGLTMS